jgi:hypothetical protein
MIDLDAIRARDATQFEMYHKSCHDRRALLAYVDALRAAAGKVTCRRCEGFGELKSPYEEGAGMDDADPCPDCTPLRALIKEAGQ